MPGPVRNPAEAFQQLEAVMLRQMLQSSGAFRASDSPGAKLRTDMFVETLADAVAKAGGLGIARMLERQLGHPASATAPPAGASARAPHVSLPVDNHARLSPRAAPAVSSPTSSTPRAAIDDLDDPNSEAPLPEDPNASSIDEFQGPIGKGHSGAAPHAGAASDGITSGFGPRIHPITHDRRFHTGIDLRAPEGAPIQAVAAGVVVEAGRRGGYGNTVQIDHGNGTSSLYAHASSLLVDKGQRVEPGQTVALVGKTGHATGPHLHFEIRRHDHPVDPTRHVPISVARALNTYRERAEAEEAGTPPGAGTGVTP